MTTHRKARTRHVKRADGTTETIREALTLAGWMRTYGRACATCHDWMHVLAWDRGTARERFCPRCLIHRGTLRSSEGFK